MSISLNEIINKLSQKISSESLIIKAVPFIQRDLKKYSELINNIIDVESKKNINKTRVENTIIDKCIEMLYEERYLVNSSAYALKQSMSKINTMNLSKQLQVDKKLFSGESYSKENTLQVKKNKINQIYQNVENSYNISQLLPYKKSQINSLKKNMYTNDQLELNENIKQKIERKFKNLKIPEKKLKEVVEPQKESITSILRRRNLIKQEKLNSLPLNIRKKYNNLTPEFKTEISTLFENSSIENLSVLIDERYKLLKKQYVNNDPKKLLNLLLVLSQDLTMTNKSKKDLLLDIAQLNNSSNINIKKYLDLLRPLHSESFNSTSSTPNFIYALKNAIKFYNQKMTRMGRSDIIIQNNVNSIITNYNKDENILDFCINLLDHYEKILQLYINSKKI